MQVWDYDNLFILLLFLNSLEIICQDSWLHSKGSSCPRGVSLRFGWCPNCYCFMLLGRDVVEKERVIREVHLCIIPIVIIRLRRGMGRVGVVW